MLCCSEHKHGQYLFDKKDHSATMDHFVASSLELTMIFYLFPSIKLPTIGIIYIKEVGNFTELVEFKSEPK
jgi:hypothetical protein